jgi:hypothetical protein
MKRIMSVLAVAMVVCIHGVADAKTSKAVMQEIQEFGSSIKGTELFLKCTVIRISARGRFSAGKATDATNVFPDGNIYYQGTIEGGVQINTQDAAEFTEEARRKLLAAENNRAAVLSVDRGSKVVIHDIEVEDDETRIQLTLPGSYYSEVKSTVRFKMFDDVNSLDDFKRMFDKAFAKEEFEVLRGNKTIEINQGTTTNELIKLIGLADYRINLGAKTILVYGSTRYIFADDVLVDLN